MQRRPLLTLIFLGAATLALSSQGCGSITPLQGDGAAGNEGTAGTGATGTGGTGAGGTGGRGAAGGSSGGSAGGTGGAAGASAGGHAGDGGHAGSAGGHAGDGGGGAGGSGGHGGGAGSGGAAGSGAAGHGGGAGGTAGIGETCDQLASDYAAALPAARACTPGATDQCQALVPSQLSSCSNCQTYVNDTSRLEPIITQWTNQSCQVQTGVVCPLIACIAPGTGTCAADDGGSPGGTCQNGLTPLQ